MSACDFSTLYTTLPRRLLGGGLVDLMNRAFVRVSARCLACNEECAFFTSDVYNNHNLWSCRKVCDALFTFWIIFLLDLELNFVSRLLMFRWGADCAPLIAGLFLFSCGGISWGLSHVKIRLTLLELSVQLQDTLMIN